MLTIGQLAGYVGVSVRTVRHYHQLGLLPEPDRDVSGYRRYGAEDVIRLRRVVTLAQAGVPLARIGALLAAEPDAFGAALAEIDAAMDAEIRTLQQRRRDLAALPSAERLCLGDDVAEILEWERSLGLSERVIAVERDSWILLAAAYPDVLGQAVAQRRAFLEDEDYRRMALALDAAADWDRDDPRLPELARLAMTVMTRLYPPEAAQRASAEWSGTDDVTARLLQQMNDEFPAWQRLYELVGELTRERGYPAF